MKRSVFILVAAGALLGVAAASTLASSGTRAAKARIAIVAKGHGGSGTFTYRDRNGAVKDSGLAADAGGGKAFFDGKKGTFYIKWGGPELDAGNGWSVSTGKWSFVRGTGKYAATGKYAGISGGGRFAGVFNLDLREFVRFGGLATGGP